METRITEDDLEKVYEITKGVLKSAEREYLFENGTKKPLEQIEIMRLMLAIGCTQYWVAKKQWIHRMWPPLAPIVEKWRNELKR